VFCVCQTWLKLSGNGNECKPLNLGTKCALTAPCPLADDGSPSPRATSDRDQGFFFQVMLFPVRPAPAPSAAPAAPSAAGPPGRGDPVLAPQMLPKIFPTPGCL